MGKNLYTQGVSALTKRIFSDMFNWFNLEGNAMAIEHRSYKGGKVQSMLWTNPHGGEDEIFYVESGESHEFVPRSYGRLEIVTGFGHFRLFVDEVEQFEPGREANVPRARVYIRQGARVRVEAHGHKDSMVAFRTLFSSDPTES